MQASPLTTELQKAEVLSLQATRYPEELHLARFARTAWRWKVLICVVCLGTALIGWFIASRTTPSYRAHAVVELLGINQNFQELRQSEPTVNPLAGSDAGFLETQAGILRSDALISAVVEKLHLVGPDVKASPGLLGRLGFTAPSAPEPSDQLEAAIAKAKTALHIENVRQSSLLDVYFDDRDPRIAADFVNTLINEAAEEAVNERFNMNRRVSGWLSKHSEVLRDRMEHAERELQDYSRTAGIIYTSSVENSSIAETQLAQIETELSQAQNDRIQKEAIARMRSTDPASLPQILDDSSLRDYETKLEDLRRQQAELSTVLAPQNPKLSKIASQIQELEQTIASERKNIVGRIQQEFETAKERESMLKAAYDARAASVSAEAVRAIHYNTLKREVETTRALYEAMLRRVNDAEVASLIRANELRMVDPAMAPTKPHFPDKPVFAGIGFASGIFISLGFVFSRVKANRTIEQPGESKRLLSVSELGVIPSLGSKPAVVVERSKWRPWTNGLTSAEVADSFRGIVNSILFRNDDGQQFRLISVCSPEPGDGKTSFVINLGLAFAEVGLRVLLVDGDFRRPSLNSHFHLPSEPGVLDLLSSAEKPMNVMTRVLPTDIDGVSLLPVGTGKAPSATLLHSDRLRDLFREARERFDIVLVDCAPLLAVPESRIVARASDASVLVLRSGVTTLESALAARQVMDEDRITLLGSILNDCKPKKNYYAYRYKAQLARNSS